MHKDLTVQPFLTTMWKERATRRLVGRGGKRREGGVSMPRLSAESESESEREKIAVKKKKRQERLKRK